MPLVRLLLLLMLALLGACTMRSAIDTLAAPEDKALAQEMVAHLRSGDEAWLQQRFRPDLWEQSGKQIGQAPDLYPTAPGTTELVSFNISSSRGGGTTQRTKEFSLVTHGGGRWTVTSFRTYSTGGPDLVVQWSVVPHASPPPELTIMQAWDAAVPWIWGGVIVILLLIGGLIFWLVRRSRRKHDPLIGQGRGTP